MHMFIFHELKFEEHLHQIHNLHWSQYDSLKHMVEEEQYIMKQELQQQH